MVKHVVLWKLREFATQEERRAAIETIRGGLEALVGVVPGLLSAQVGENFTPGGYDLSLLSELASREALAGYQEHPEHVKVKAFVHSAITQRVVCDWDC